MTKLFTVLFLFVLTCAVSFAQSGTFDGLIAQNNDYNKPISLTQTVKYDALNAIFLLNNHAYQSKSEKYAHRAAILFYTGVGIQVLSPIEVCVFVTRTNRVTPILIGGAGLLIGLGFEIAGIRCIDNGRVAFNGKGIIIKIAQNSRKRHNS
jgi:hypothetical protein